MKRQIFIRMFVSAIIGIFAVVGVIVFLFHTGRWTAETDIYLLATIVVIAALIVFVAAVASAMTSALTKKIVNSVEEISLENSTFKSYHELVPYAAKIQTQKEKLNTKIEELIDRSGAIETIIENMQEGLILVDASGVILSANSTASEVFGERLERRNIIHIYREAGFQKAIKKCLKGANMEMQIEREAKVYTVFFSPVFSDEQADIRGAVILFHDVTEQHKAEVQRREFSANVSHELKTPLTTISALSEMIAQGMAKSEDIEIFAKRIKEQSGRLLVLIDDIIRLSEFDEGAVGKEFSVFNIRELAESVIASLSDSAGDTEIELVGYDFDISANYRMIDELLYNLIDNGIKYNKENGKVTVILAQDEDGKCKISVSDTGIGIEKHHHGRVFERFYRVDKSRSKKTGGTGLGLSIVKHITEYHGGRAQLESSVQSGTTVTCII